jgi:hypothetical protein
MLITNAHPSLDIINHTNDMISYTFHNILFHSILDSDG